jgi:RND family efflux transporter MFP subunit
MAAGDKRHEPATASPPAAPSRGLRRLGAAAAAAAVVIALLGILQRRGHEAEVAQWTRDQAVPTVAVIAPQPGASKQAIVLPGTVQAWYETPIYARVNGYVKDWYFDYGAHVKKGDLLAELDAPDIDAQLAATQAKLNSARATVKVREAEKQFAETTYERWRDSPKGVVSLQEQESKQADYNSAVARLNAATAEVAADQGEVDRLQALEGFKRITAPFDGVVTARETDVGALINAGSGTGGGSGGGSGPELFRVADIHEMRIYVQVPQQLSADIRQGLTADLHLPQYPDKTFTAKVATTSSAINTTARTLLVELHADNPDSQLQPGAYAQVDFALPGNPDVVRVPTSALLFRQQGLEVAVIGAGDKIELRPVTLGRNLGTEVEVLKGLTVSDRVVNSPPDSLAAGDLVRLAAQPAGPRAGDGPSADPPGKDLAAAPGAKQP